MFTHTVEEKEDSFIPISISGKGGALKEQRKPRRRMPLDVGKAVRPSGTKPVSTRHLVEVNKVETAPHRVGVTSRNPSNASTTEENWGNMDSLELNEENKREIQALT